MWWAGISSCFMYRAFLLYFPLSDKNVSYPVFTQQWVLWARVVFSCSYSSWHNKAIIMRKAYLCWDGGKSSAVLCYCIMSKVTKAPNLSQIYFENLFLRYSVVFEIKQIASVWGTAPALFLQDKNHRIYGK